MKKLILVLFLFTLTSFGATPINDLGCNQYFGFEGGLYENCSNAVPEEHSFNGLFAATQIVPRNISGTPDVNGKIVLISIGMSNTAAEWGYFKSIAKDHPDKNPKVVIENGAQSKKPCHEWDSFDEEAYDRIKFQFLEKSGLSEAQVQSIWLKCANNLTDDAISLPSPDAEAYIYYSQLDDILRSAKIRYTNLQQVFISSRIYGGYALGPLNPEPFAYEYAFPTKWAIQAQIDGHPDFTDGIPWIAWGPYLWADDGNPRSDGLVWLREDFKEDGVHPSPLGRQKVAEMLLNFFLTSPYTTWFRDGN